MATLSVLMPFRNAREFVHPAVESILAQSYSDFELLAIDDGGTDDSVELIRGFDDPRIRIITTHGSGVAAALNTGLAARHHDARFVARHDADDLSDPRRFATQVRYLDDNPDIDVLATEAVTIDRVGVVTGTFDTPIGHQRIVDTMRQRNPLCHGSVMARPAAIEQVGGYDTDYPCSQDYDLWVRMAHTGFRFDAIPARLYRYRVYGQSWSQSQRALRDELSARIAEAAASL